MKLVTAIVRDVGVDRVVGALEGAGFRGITLSEIKGVGEGPRVNTPYSIHDKIEIIVPDEEAERVVAIIVENARSGLAGDGVITVAPLEQAVKIRTKERLG